MLSALWAVAAVGLSSAPAAPSALDAGKELYLRLEFGKAVEHLQGAVADLEAAFPETGDFSRLGEGLTLLAASQLGLKDEPGARAAFMKLLELRPSFELDVNTYGPKVAQVFERARAAMAQRPRAALEILCVPEATVVLDGVPRGKTPLKVAELVVGRHGLRLEAPDHEPWWGMVDLAVGGSSYPRSLVPVPGTVPVVVTQPKVEQEVLVAPAPAPKRLHAYAAPFLDVLNRSAGAEVGASFSLIPQVELVGSAVVGGHPGGQLGVGLGFARGNALLRPFAQLRGAVLALKGGAAVGGGLWLGGSCELGPGRVLAGASVEGYVAPAGYAPFAVLVLAGYELDAL